MKTVAIVFSIVLMVSGIGCVALSSYITPADLDGKAVQYVVDAGIAELTDYKAWYPNLALAKRLPKDLTAANLLNQQVLQQMMDKDNTVYNIFRGTTVLNRNVALEREEALFGESGLVSLGLGMLGFGGFTGLLGLMRKRPQDITKDEMENAVATIQSKTKEELSLKEKQMIQLVKGVQMFIDGDKTPVSGGKVLKNYMNVALDKDTQAAVAVIKKTVI